MSGYTPEQEIAICEREIEQAIRYRDEHQRLVGMFDEEIAAAEDRIAELKETPVLGATLMVNREPVGHVEVVRVATGEDGNHTYRYRCYEQGSVLEYGNVTHQESKGPYVLLRKALEGITNARF